MRHRLEYLGVRLVIVLVQAMPGRLVDRAGELLGRAVYLFDRTNRRVAERNVAAAFPGRSRAEQQKIVRGAFAHFGRLLMELLKFSTLSPDCSHSCSADL